MNTTVNTSVVAFLMLATLGMQSTALAGPGEVCPAGQIGLALDTNAIAQSKTLCIPGESLRGIMTAASKNESLGTVACPCWEHSFFLDTFETGGILGWSGGVVDGVFRPYRAAMRDAATGGQINFDAWSSAYYGSASEYAHCAIYGINGASVTTLNLTWFPDGGQYDPITVEEADACVSDIIWSYCTVFPDRCHP